MGEAKDYRDESLTDQERVENLLEQMSLEEKVSQLSFQAREIKWLGIPAYNWWNEALHGVARAGVATVFPQAIGMAASFDRSLLRQAGEIVATEGRSKYNEQSRQGDRGLYKGLTFWAPNVNIFRDPRWGRGQETYGEDPLLTGELAVCYIQGIQGDGRRLKAAACAKHFA
ncbi:MAG TPA: glycoside hydrolase family 3 protein, partial [Candidatus Pullilachnospira stercoravium]|nr:glycoside hydrolase family 3 protein [Candidatus Pullilachnospira stercoravium]